MRAAVDNVEAYFRRLGHVDGMKPLPVNGLASCCAKNKVGGGIVKEKSLQVISKNIVGLLRCALLGESFPHRLSSAALDRILIELGAGVDPDRAMSVERIAVVKAAKQRSQEMNEAYRLGMWLAVVVRAQEAACNKSTVLSSNLSLMSREPRRVMDRVFTKFNYYLSLLRRNGKVGLARYFENKGAEALGGILPEALPSKLDKDARADFVLGIHAMRSEINKGKEQK